MHRITLVFVLAFVVGLVPALADIGVTWSTGGAYIDNIGNNVGAYNGILYDTLTLTGQSGSLSFPPGSQFVQIAEMDFSANLNCWVGTVCPNVAGTVSQDITVNGLTQSLALSSLWSATIGASDTLTLYGGDTVIFDLGSGHNLDVTPLGYAFAPNPGGDEAGKLYAKFVVTPEPGAILLLVTMLACVAGARKLRLV